MNFPLLLDITATKKLGPSVPPMITDHILDKKVSVITFRQILPKVLLVAYIFSNTITMIWRSSLEINPLIQSSIQQDYLPELSPEPLWESLRWGRILASSQKFTHFPQQKNSPGKSTTSAMKKANHSPSNSSFHLITLYKFHL